MDIGGVDDGWGATARDVHDALRAELTSTDAAVVATVVDVEGSAYRRPGAKMVLAEDTERRGVITAGCLDGPVADLADDVFDTGRSLVETFDLTNEDEWGLGLGCNGVIDVMLEPLDDSWRSALEALADGVPVAMVTAVSSERPDVGVGDRTVIGVDDSQSIDRPPLPDAVMAEVADEIEAFRTDGESGILRVDTDAGAVDLFVDTLEPVPTVLLFGSQDDVNPVATLANRMGFRVTVACPRGARANADAFPAAHRVVGRRPTDLDSDVTQPGRTYAVLMSHNLLDDMLALETLLTDTAVPYVGLMGPRKRFQALREEAADNGIEFTDDELNRVSTPVGLNLGSGEPAHIALSVVSEVLAVHNDRDGGRLKDHAGPIHDRVQPID